jgi:hypothetical protein
MKSDSGSKILYALKKDEGYEIIGETWEPAHPTVSATAAVAQ